MPWLASQRNAEAPNYAPVNLADRLTGLHAVYAVTAALFHRERTGEGQSVEVPMFESVAHFVLGDHTAGLDLRPAAGRARLCAAARAASLCDPRRFHLRARVQRQAVEELLRGDRPARAVDRSRATPARPRARSNIVEIYDAFAEMMKQRTTDEWIALLEKADIPVARMNSIADVLADPHLKASGFFEPRITRAKGKLHAPAHPPVGPHRSRGAQRRPATASGRAYTEQRLP